jgi:hypothetical protein
MMIVATLRCRYLASRSYFLCSVSLLVLFQRDVRFSINDLRSIEVRSLVEQLGYFSAIFEAETAFIAQNIRVRMVITNCATAASLLALGPATLSAAMF